MQEQRGRAALAIWGAINLLFLCSSVLFLRSAPELGSSAQLLLNCLCADYSRGVAWERGRLHSGVRTLS